MKEPLPIFFTGSLVHTVQMDYFFNTIKNLVYEIACVARYKKYGTEILRCFWFDYEAAKDKKEHVEGSIVSRITNDHELTFTVCIPHKVDNRKVIASIDRLLTDYQYLMDTSLNVLSNLRTIYDSKDVLPKRYV